VVTLKRRVRERGVGRPLEKRQRTGALAAFARLRRPKQNLAEQLSSGKRFASWSAVALYRFGTEGEYQAAAIGRERGVMLRAPKTS
jgi:hypothetical protein